ncbi:MAG: hypothetical protein CBC35_10220 [Planctomycetes bacterium TMED75]|nr:MAG: hypothetical protein CBC35_10220 [Planctomycetes bacterium TMED75]
MDRSNAQEMFIMAPRTPYSHNQAMTALLARYTVSLVQHSDDLARALVDSDLDRILDLSHKLKGSAGGYGFDSISQAAAMIEHETLMIEADISQITSRVEDLISLCRNPIKDVNGGSDVHSE